MIIRSGLLRTGTQLDGLLGTQPPKCERPLSGGPFRYKLCTHDLSGTA